jgi:uncharacterized membrane protein
LAQNKELVLAFFPSEVAADEVVQALKASNDIDPAAIGILVKDKEGRIQTHKLGRRAGRKGAGIGVVLGIVAAVLSGGLTLLGGVVGGALLGGVTGAFFHKNLGMSKEDVARINTALDGGRAAVGVLVDASDAAWVSASLKNLGGETEAHVVSAEALEHAAAEDNASPSAEG